MKNLFSLVLLELVFSCSVFSSPIDTTTAKTSATNLFLSRASTSSIQRVRSLASKQIELELVHQELEEANDQSNSEPYYYVYNVNDNNGYIIISADDAVTPVLAYSFEGSYDNNNLPPAFVAWMENYKRQIKFIKENNLSQPANIKAEWNKSLLKSLSNSQNITDFIPLLGRDIDVDKIRWNQDCNYNLDCPILNDCVNGCNNRAPAGCIPVAMGQIMRYWKYPKMSNYIPGYTLIRGLFGINNIEIPAVDQKYYDWSNIRNYLSDNSSLDEKKAISELLKNCGVSIKIDYDCESSGLTDNSPIPNSLVNYFNFKNNLKHISFSDYNTDVDWFNVIKGELDNGRPVFYSGTSIPGGSHAFVCDGYRGDTELHFNWGWGINFPTSYCTIDRITPNNGTDYTDVNYKFIQKAIIGILPNEPDLFPINQSLSTSTIQVGSSLTAYCAEKNFGSIAAGANVISIHLSSDAVLTPGNNGDRYIDEIAASGVTANSTSSTFSKSITIPSDVSAGTYYVYFSVDGGETIDEIYEDNNFASAMLTVTAAPITLNPPRNLSAIAGNGQVTLNWTAPVSGTPTGYKVYISASQNGTYTSTSQTLTTKTYTGLTNGITYWFYVEAVYSTGVSATSKISATPNVTTTSYPPRNLMATGGNGLVNLSWSSPSSGTPSSYNIYKSTSQSGSYSFYSSSATTSVTVTGLTNGTTYWFYVKAVYSSDISESSNIVNATPNTSTIPLNDNCSSATLLTSSTISNYLESQTVNNATASGKPKANIDGYTGTPVLADVWYYFKATATTHTINVDPNGSQLDAVIALYSSCSNNAELGSSDITGGNGTFSYLTVSGLTIGNYYFIRLYDYGQQTTDGGFKICVIGENNEVDDDFYISNVNVPSTSIGVNGTVKVSCDQCYFGPKEDSELGSTTVGYYLSKNSIFDSKDILLASELSNLGDDDPCNSESESITIPGNTIPGLYYILFVADCDQSYNEGDEENNVEAVQITVNSTSHDFYILNEAVYPDKFLASELITFKCDLCYSGSSLDSEISSCRLGYYFSTDKSFNSSTDTYIGAYITGMGSDDPLKNSSYSQASIPTGTSPGNYYILLVADDDNRFVETNEINNVKFVPITVVGNSSSEDFYIQDFTISSTTVIAGGGIDVTCTQSYIGSILDANMSSSVVGYYLSTDASFSSTDDIKLGTDGSSLGSDYPYESESATLTIPEATPSGNYYILFVADYDNRFSEANEKNNTCYAEINIKNVTDIHNVEACENIKISPNPTTGKFEISEIEALGNKFKVDVVDSQGKIIYTSVYFDFGNKISLDLSSYPEGLYLIRLSNDEACYHKKVIKK